MGENASKIATPIRTPRQGLLQRAAMACFGKFAGGNPRHAESARHTIRDRLRRKCTLMPWSMIEPSRRVDTGVPAYS
jgi:hypothetical protein